MFYQGKNMINFEKDRQHLIEDIKKRQEILNTLIEKNQQLKVISPSEIGSLQEIHKKNEKLLHKLESKEFEIAIVGLEKAGKSTFSNALIENNVLPSAPERCTFTSTRLVSGQDKAYINFYTEEEFNKIFVKLLEEVEYPIAEDTSFRTLSLEDFTRYFNELEETKPNLYKNHIGKTDEEIKDILNNRDKLILTGEKKQFTGDELQSENFQSYIKGKKINDETDTSRPRSVKELSIESSKLNQLETAIIYDVPGFDSPTKIHIRQTEERLKNADAIILVTNVGRNPSIQGTSLSVINKNTDDDGIALKDKLFVFGNQLDTANSLEESQGNKKTLINDVKKYQIGEEKRVFVGSALKYLIEKNIVKDEFHEKFEIDSGISAIRESLIDYYQNERFQILKRKINSNKKNFNDILKKVVEESDENPNLNFNENSERTKIIVAERKALEKRIKTSLEDLKHQLKREILNEQLFSANFKDKISAERYFQSITADDIEETEKRVANNVTLDIPIQKINHDLRETLHIRFLREFSDLIKELTDEKAKEVENRIFQIFTEAVVNGQVSIDVTEKIEVKVIQLINRITADVAHNEGRFEYLIERFSRNLFDIMIASPIASYDRKDKFDKAQQEFIYLDSFFDGGKGSLIYRVLSGKKQNLFNSVVQLSKITSDLINVASGIPSKHSYNKLKDIKHLAEIAIHQDTSIKNIFTEEVLKDIQPCKTKLELLEEINTDIENLKEILQVAVIPAINLELAFLNSVDKQIKLLISAVMDTNSTMTHSNLFDNFASEIIPIIKQDEINNINEKIETHKLRVQLLEDIKEVI